MKIDPLLVDVYEGDVHGSPNWSALAADPDVRGAIIKATEGVRYAPGWFARNWPEITRAGAKRQGWTRGCYHFLRFDLDGAKQADFYLATVEHAGGWSPTDLIPIVDVEMGGDRHPNHHASKQQVVDSTSAWIERVKQKSGCGVMLYGNGAMRDLGICDRMGADWLWLPRYTAALPRAIYERAGWTVDRLALWQYCGDGVGKLAGYPTSIPGFGRVDISVAIERDLTKYQRGIV